MKRSLAPALAIATIMSAACVRAVSVPPLPVLPGTITPAVASEFVPTVLPITPTYAGCASVWGTQELSELSTHLNAKLQDISTDVTGLAYAYGENCVYGDGHQTFTATETDFRIGIKVVTVRDEGTLGDWISKIMTIILDFPEDQLPGPQSGRVDFSFKQPDPEALFVTVPIDKYRREAGRLHGAALLRLFYPNP